MDIVAQVARDCGMPVAQTAGFYREPWISEETHAAGIDESPERMIGELFRKFPAAGVDHHTLSVVTHTTYLRFTFDNGLAKAGAHKVNRMSVKENNGTEGGHTASYGVRRDAHEIIRALREAAKEEAARD